MLRGPVRLRPGQELIGETNLPPARPRTTREPGEADLALGAPAVLALHDVATAGSKCGGPADHYEVLLLVNPGVQGLGSRVLRVGVLEEEVIAGLSKSG